ncbi:MAG: hypothetical protein COU69_04025 [Candidatus Pacebacteria bacterium CG10_big_fil_rev_8_21_14_0_10_56_10]|nr:MAG: hypothetical protein COU69_04025 [Candidatus Pacebacteria bacterium CG10_big_fil_rev_8_21_14_0_10_56_10]
MFVLTSVVGPLPISDRHRHWLEFLLAMTRKEVNVRYKHAAFGFAWIVINPLLQMVILGIVFRFFVPVQVDNYFLFLFTGLLPWMFFSLSVSKNTPAYVFERNLIQKAKFPREAIVLSIILANLFHLLIALGLLALALVADKVVFEQYSALRLLGYLARMLWLVPLVAWLSLLTSGLSLLTSTLNVRFRDVNFIVQAAMPLWFYATPIVYTLDLLPSLLHPLFYLNPMTAVIEGFHWTLLRIPPASPQLGVLSVAVSAVILWAGLTVFRRESPTFDDWI